MPVSGNEETRIKSNTRQISDYIIGIPIKKRRFPLIQPSSPQSEDRSSLTVDGDSVQREQSSSSTCSNLSNANVLTTSVLYGTNQNSVHEESKEKSDISTGYVVQNNGGCIKVKLEEPSHARELDYCEPKKGLVVADKSAVEIPLGRTDLKLAPSDSNTDNIGREINGKKQFEGKFKLEIRKIPEKPELSLGLKGHLVPVLSGERSNVNCLNQKNLEHMSLNSSLIEHKSSLICDTGNVKMNANGSCPQSNRANWDLNTTMDSWEDSGCDAPAVQISVAGINKVDGTHDVKPLISSTWGVGTDIPSRKQTASYREPGANISISCRSSGQEYMSNDSLHLSLGSSGSRPNVSQDPSTSSGKLDLGMVSHNLSSLQVGVAPRSLDMVGTIVKSEPIDKSIKKDLKGAKVNLMGLSDRPVKRESGEWCNSAASTPSNVSDVIRLGSPRSIKSELVHEVNLETPKLWESILNQSEKQVVQSMTNNSSAVTMPMAEMKVSGRKSSCPTKFSVNGECDLFNQSGYYSHTEGCPLDVEVSQESCERAEQVTLNSVQLLKVLHEDDKDEDVKDEVVRVQDAVRAEDRCTEDPEGCRLKFMNEHSRCLQGCGEGCSSDEEKINISADMLEEDSFCSDYESDGNQAFPKTMDAGVDDEDDYEDGEVREPLVNAEVEESVYEKKEVEDNDHGDSDVEKANFVGPFGHDHSISFHVDRVTGTDDLGQTSNENQEVRFDSIFEIKTTDDENKDLSSQKSFSVEEKIIADDVKRPLEDMRRKELDISDKRETLDGEAISDPGPESSHVSVGADEIVKRSDTMHASDSTLPKVEMSVNDDNAAKDANVGSCRSRIINLSRTSDLSPGRTKSFVGRSFPSQTGSERLSDGSLEVGKFHPRGRSDSFQKFSRERNQDSSPRNSRMNFMHDRERLNSRVNTLRGGDWNHDNDFGQDIYNGSTEYRMSRQKYGPAVSDANLEYNNYNLSSDGTFFGAGRGRRKPLNGEGPMFRNMPSRRRSPLLRDGPPIRGSHMVRRIPRNISLGRCINEDGSDMAGVRHNEQYIKTFSDDNGPVFTHPQPPYGGMDRQFSRGSRNFSSLQRRDLPRIRSKSPVRSRSRSPGPWSSPRRRSPDGFGGGHPELTHRRSTTLYRVERMRSPDRPCFRGEMAIRGHGSPSYVSRPSSNMRDLGSERDHSHPRSVIPNRSPSGRLFIRNRRTDITDLRERTETDEYFGGLVHSGRLHELADDGNGDERRNFGERRPVRSFRPPVNADGENFHINDEDGSRTFRFFPGDDTEFRERGSMRGRGFERRIKSGQGNLPRRTRSIEEHEGNYRHCGPVWHDDGFGDISRVKRKRF